MVHLSSIRILRAVFFPIPGTPERSFSSFSATALMSHSEPIPKRAKAVFPPTPLILSNLRKSTFSLELEKPYKALPLSVMCSCKYHDTSVPVPVRERQEGLGRISRPIPVFSARTVTPESSEWTTVHRMYPYMGDWQWGIFRSIGILGKIPRQKHEKSPPPHNGVGMESFQD